MKLPIILLFSSLAFVAGCNSGPSRPDQDNFLVDLRGVGAAKLAEQLSRALNGTRYSDRVPRTTVQFHGIQGSDFEVGIDPVPDNRCDADNFNETYADMTYRIDLVYKAEGSDRRAELREALLKTAQRLKVPIEKLKDCS